MDVSHTIESFSVSHTINGAMDEEKTNFAPKPPAAAKIMSSS